MKSVEIPLRHLTLRGWERNEGASKKILAFHGWLDNADSFLDLAKYLPEDFHLISLDLVGHGHSDWRAPGSTYHFLDYVTDTKEILNTLSWKNCILMGHSLGASIAAIAGSVFKEQVIALVLLEGLGPLTNTGPESPEFYKRFLKQQFSKWDPQFRYASFESVLQRRLKASIMKENSARTILKRSLEQDDQGWRWRSDPRHMGRNPSRLTEEQVLAFLEEIKCPTFLLEADKGEYFHFPHKVLPKRLLKIKDLDHVKVPGNHHVHMDQAQECSLAINRFLTQLRNL